MKSIGMFSFDQETITVYTKTNTVPFKTITNSMRIFVLFIIFFSAGKSYQVSQYNIFVTSPHP